jgi:hypothetical protein
MRLAEIILETPLQPTKVFIPFHGNYCGPGNRGGMPIDSLDRACFKHDCEYDKSYKEDRAARKKRQLQADYHFAMRAMKVAQDETLKRSVRLKAMVAAKYFILKIQKAKMNVPQPAMPQPETLPMAA